MDDYDVDDLAADHWDMALEPNHVSDYPPIDDDFEPGDIDGGELSFDPYAGTAIYGEDDDSGWDGFDY